MIHIQLYTYTCGSQINNNDEQTHFFRKIYLSHFIQKGCERVMCERWVGDWTDCNILTPSSSVFSSTSFSFCWAVQPGVLRAQPTLGAGSHYSISSPTPNLSVAPGYIIIWHPPASCGRHIGTQFNPSTVKVIPWYLRPDAPVIYTGESLIWLVGRGSIFYNRVPMFVKSEENFDFIKEIFKQISIDFVCLGFRIYLYVWKSKLRVLHTE